MRSLFLALLLTLAFAGTSHAQERVRDVPRPAAQAAPAGADVRAVNARAAVRAGVRKQPRGALLQTVRAQAARRAQTPRVKRAAAPRD